MGQEGRGPETPGLACVGGGESRNLSPAVFQIVILGCDPTCAPVFGELAHFCFNLPAGFCLSRPCDVCGCRQDLDGQLGPE